MLNVNETYGRLKAYNNKKVFEVQAASDSSATLVNNLNALSGQCSNLVDVIAQVEAAKSSKDGEAMDKALDELRARMKEFTSVGKICKQEMLNFVKPMVKQG